MNSLIPRLSDLFRRRIALEDELKAIDEEIASLIPHKALPAPRKPAVKPKAKTAKKSEPASTGTWSRKYDKCIDCGTSSLPPHRSGGRCTKCYGIWFAAQLKEKRQGTKKGHSKWSRTAKSVDKPVVLNNTPGSSAAFTYQCDCGMEFKSVLDVDLGEKVSCPECGVEMAHVNKF